MSARTIAEPVAVGGKIRVFALCLDAAAVERARWLARQLSSHGPARREIRMQTWKLSPFVAAVPIPDSIAQDAANSDLLVVSISSLDRREPALAEWLDSIANWNQSRRRCRLLIGLFGDEDHPAGELAWLVNKMGGMAGQSGIQFLWQWQAEGSMQDTEWLEAAIEEAFGRDAPSQAGFFAAAIPSAVTPAGPD